MHRTTPSFRACLARLPEHVQRMAEARFRLLKADPTHPSLCFKKVAGLWSVRASRSHRALAVEDGRDFVWTWIGAHDEYKQLLKRRARWIPVGGLAGSS